MHIEPFSGIFYDKKKTGRLERVLAPPYDVISSAQQDHFYKASPYNIIRIILNKPTNKDNKANNTYTRAAGFFNKWYKGSIIKQDTEPAIYVYGQTFKHNGKLRRTLGFIAAAQIEDSGRNAAIPHENTFKKPKLDRGRLLASVKASACFIHTLFPDRDFKVSNILRAVLSRQRPFISVVSEGVRHQLWRMADERLIKRLQALIKNKKILIADGHHRYAACVNYRNRMRLKDRHYSKDSPYNYTTMYFVSLDSRDLAILPTHRMVSSLGSLSIGDFKNRLKEYFQIIKTGNQKAMLVRLALGGLRAEFVFGFYAEKSFYALRLKNKAVLKQFFSGLPAYYKKLDVVALHKIIFENILKFKAASEKISYTRDPDAAVSSVDEAKCKAAFFLNPTKISQVYRVCAAGLKMPHKSTYFYPKPLSGLVMRSLYRRPNV